MIKKRVYSIITFLSVIILLVVSFFVFYKPHKEELNNNHWTAYFAPTSTAIAYGNNDATLIDFDSTGKINYYNVDAYPFTGMVNYNNNLIFQNPKGLTKLNTNLSNLNITVNENTVGYNMANVIKGKDIYYFLLNESFKENFYSSKLILGNNSNEYLHQIEGFVNSYGNDDNNVYLLTSDMIDRYSKELQKISINSIDNITVEKNKLVFDSIVESNCKMISIDNYLYCFIIKDRYTVSLLKISKNTLTIENTFDLIKFDSSIENDLYYPISENSFFHVGEKIYYPTIEGKIYSFNVKTTEFIEEFSIQNYNINSSSNILSAYSESNNELYFFYLDKSSGKYKLDTYNLSGKLIYNISLDNLNIKDKLYPHSFIKWFLSHITNFINIFKV